MPTIHARAVSNDGSTMPMERVIKVNDILDWLSSIFGFQVTPPPKSIKNYMNNCID